MQIFLGSNTPHLQPTSGWLLSHRRFEFQRASRSKNGFWIYFLGNTYLKLSPDFEPAARLFSTYTGKVDKGDRLAIFIATHALKAMGLGSSVNGKCATLPICR
jgi:hypothetical protein